MLCEALSYWYTAVSHDAVLPVMGEKQAEFALQMVQRPHVDPDRFTAVWDEVLALMDTYELAP